MYYRKSSRVDTRFSAPWARSPVRKVRIRWLREARDSSWVVEGLIGALEGRTGKGGKGGDALLTPRESLR